MRTAQECELEWREGRNMLTTEGKDTNPGGSRGLGKLSRGRRLQVTWSEWMKSSVERSCFEGDRRLRC